MKYLNVRLGAFLLMNALLLTGCGSSTVAQLFDPTYLKGSVATGAPVPYAAVSIKDKSGNVLSGTADQYGWYSIKYDTITVPFIVKAEGVVAGESKTYYAIAYSVPSPSILNVNPASTALAESSVKTTSTTGVDLASVFANFQTVASSPGSNTDNSLKSEVEANKAKEKLNTALDGYMKQMGDSSSKASDMVTPPSEDQAKADKKNANDRMLDCIKENGKWPSGRVKLTIKASCSSTGQDVDIPDVGDDKTTVTVLPTNPGYQNNNPVKAKAQFLKENGPRVDALLAELSAATSGNSRDTLKRVAEKVFTSTDSTNLAAQLAEALALFDGGTVHGVVMEPHRITFHSGEIQTFNVTLGEINMCASVESVSLKSRKRHFGRAPITFVLKSGVWKISLDTPAIAQPFENCEEDSRMQEGNAGDGDDRGVAQQPPVSNGGVVEKRVTVYAITGYSAGHGLEEVVAVSLPTGYKLCLDYKAVGADEKLDGPGITLSPNASCSTDVKASLALPAVPTPGKKIFYWAAFVKNGDAGGIVSIGSGFGTYFSDGKFSTREIAVCAGTPSYAATTGPVCDPNKKDVIGSSSPQPESPPSVDLPASIDVAVSAVSAYGVNGGAGTAVTIGSNQQLCIGSYLSTDVPATEPTPSTDGSVCLNTGAANGTVNVKSLVPANGKFAIIYPMLVSVAGGTKSLVSKTITTWASLLSDGTLSGLENFGLEKCVSLDANGLETTTCYGSSGQNAQSTKVKVSAVSTYGAHGGSTAGTVANSTMMSGKKICLLGAEPSLSGSPTPPKALPVGAPCLQAGTVSGELDFGSLKPTTATGVKVLYAVLSDSTGVLTKSVAATVALLADGGLQGGESYGLEVCASFDTYGRENCKDSDGSTVGGGDSYQPPPPSSSGSTGGSQAIGVKLSAVSILGAHGGSAGTLATTDMMAGKRLCLSSAAPNADAAPTPTAPPADHINHLCLTAGALKGEVDASYLKPSTSAGVAVIYPVLLNSSNAVVSKTVFSSAGLFSDGSIQGMESYGLEACAKFETSGDEAFFGDMTSH